MSSVIYCLCNKRNYQRPEQFQEQVNRFVEREESKEYTTCLDKATVELNDRALCVKTGASQVTKAGVPAWPNVNIYRCLNCGNEFTVL
jgi:hypothetical protein